jgi:hypothetical protein
MLHLKKSLSNLTICKEELCKYPNKKRISVLFVLKSRDRSWNPDNKYSKGSSGLLNSARFVSDMLINNGMKSEVVIIENNKNHLELKLREFNPDIVILEAIWLSYDNLKILAENARHKNRKWVIRCHSEFPFIASEGAILSPFLKYGNIKNVYVSCNSPRATYDFGVVVDSKKLQLTNDILLLPNYYSVPDILPVKKHNGADCNIFNVSCFGAIRPLKNQLQQAIAAMAYANETESKLRFHINSTRIEGHGEAALRAIRDVFTDSKHELVEQAWLDHAEFASLCGIMDVGLKVSFSETFNIVSADHVCNGVPVVGSREIPWLESEFHADACDAIDIKDKIYHAMDRGALPQVNSLKEYSKRAQYIWIDTLTKIFISS